MKSTPQRMEIPSNLPFPLMALVKAIVPMLCDHNILILVEDATFGLQVEYIYVSKGGCFPIFKDGTDFCFVHRCLYEVSYIHIHNISLVEGQ